MAIRKWHAGKIIILWAWGGILSGFSFYKLASPSPMNFVLGFGLVVIMIGIPIILSVITWKWLGGKEN